METKKIRLNFFTKNFFPTKMFKKFEIYFEENDLSSKVIEKILNVDELISVEWIFLPKNEDIRNDILKGYFFF